MLVTVRIAVLVCQEKCKSASDRCQVISRLLALVPAMAGVFGISKALPDEFGYLAWPESANKLISLPLELALGSFPGSTSGGIHYVDPAI